ncbi:MAG TPA: C1 family peptidase [Pedobacter sp.]|uniref:C1 family peptidase n=1 Tax=Pedobacter sp. TaxID=1411316 RepID=UPI002C8A30C0|nr:C1 family peptidase [Pedobacter sp.]HMI01225.1 C1 family peptidase [Pedobacter sp.]
MTKLIFLVFTVFVVFTFKSDAQQPYRMGMNFDNESYRVVKKKAKLTRSLESLPESASIKQFSPIPGNQGMYSTCTAWASAYCGRTIVDAVKNNWLDKTYITEHAYSPAFLFRLLSPDDQSCKSGSYISMAFSVMKTKGLIPFSALSASCIPSVSNVQLASAQTGRIKDFMRLFDLNATRDIKVQSVKKSISEQKPVVFGMICPPSFFNAKGVWAPVEEADPKVGGHAMCVVGYDDNKEGGAFEIQNSWGTKWGNEGYIWIKYADFAGFTAYAYEFIDLPEAKPEVADLSGNIRLVLADNNEMPVSLFTSTRGLKVVPAKKTAEPLSVYQTASNYSSGTRFRIYISNNEPAYVYAISTDLSNEVTKIFPYEDGISAALTDKRNDIAIPDEDHFIEFDDKPGKDFLCVLYSRDELNINELVTKISSQQGSFSERIFKVLGEKMVAPENTRFSKDKIAFEGFSKGKSIVSMMVEMDHK